MKFFLFENVFVVANFGLSVCTIGDTVGRSSDGTARVTLAGCLPDPTSSSFTSSSTSSSSS